MQKSGIISVDIISGIFRGFSRFWNYSDYIICGVHSHALHIIHDLDMHVL